MEQRTSQNSLDRVSGDFGDMNELTKADLRERLGNIDQIRDILFGPQLREFSSRVDQLERGLAILQQEMRNQAEEVKQVLRTEFQAEIDTLEKRIRDVIRKDEEEKFDIRQQIDSLAKRITNATDELQQSLVEEVQDVSDSLEKKLKLAIAKDEEEKFDIRQQVELLSKRLSSNFDALDEAIDKQTTTLHENLVSTREKLQEDITDLRTQVFEELERYVSHLGGVKLSRDDMAEMLFELGLRLKGTEFVPELREAADTQKSAEQPESIERSRTLLSEKVSDKLSSPLAAPPPALAPEPIDATEETATRKRSRSRSSRTDD